MRSSHTVSPLLIRSCSSFGPVQPGSRGEISSLSSSSSFLFRKPFPEQPSSSSVGLSVGLRRMCRCRPREDLERRLEDEILHLAMAVVAGNS